MHRSEHVETFFSVALGLLDQYATDPRSRASIALFKERLKIDGEIGPAAKTIPVCDHLPEAMETAAQSAPLDGLIRALKPVLPELAWWTRQAPGEANSPEFVSGHANTMICGPKGLERRHDIWMGMTLMKPNLRYPDHHHAPEETYLVLSDCSFLVGDRGWFDVRPQDSFYVPSNDNHAMRSGDKPLFVLWTLCA